MVVWALFDSGNGSYYQVANEMEGIEIYSIGIDKENKNDHFINLDLADYSIIFGDTKMYDTLDNLPKPNLIIASPPCESWSIASAMKNGNACWKQDKLENLFGTMEGSRFTIRDYKDYDDYQFFPEKQLLTRINGELTIYNTIQIIKKYQPEYYVIENPSGGRIWEYIDKILGFNIRFENQTYYSAYDYPVMKPTKFGSNVNLELSQERVKTKINMNNFAGYNNRSNIPHKLVKDIFKKIQKEHQENRKWEY